MASVFLSRLLGARATRSSPTSTARPPRPTPTSPPSRFRLPQLSPGGRVPVDHVHPDLLEIPRGGRKKRDTAFSVIATVMGIGMLFFIILGNSRRAPDPADRPGFPLPTRSPWPRGSRGSFSRSDLLLPGRAADGRPSRNQFLIPATAPLIYNAGIIAGVGAGPLSRHGRIRMGVLVAPSPAISPSPAGPPGGA